MAALLLGVVIMAPVFLVSRDSAGVGDLDGAVEKARETCEAPDTVIAARNPFTAAIRLVPRGTVPAPPGTLVVNIDDFIASKWRDGKFFTRVAAVPLPAQLWTVVDAKTGEFLWLVTNRLSIEPSRGSFAACATLVDGLYRVRSVHKAK